MKPAIAYNLLLFLWPVLAAFLLIFTFISGPGVKFWLLVVDTEAWGQIRVGALGMCTDSVCTVSGLGYATGTQVGSIIPQFRGAGIFHLITFLFLIVGIASQAWLLPRLHHLRETRTSWLMWIAPAIASLFVLLCIIIDFALLARLKGDDIVKLSTLPSTFQSVNNGTLHSANNGTFHAANNGTATVQTLRTNSLTLRSADNLPGTTRQPGRVTPGGSFYLPIPCLALTLLWLTISIHYFQKSKTSELSRDTIERTHHKETMLARKRVKDETPGGGYGWFNFGNNGKSVQNEVEAEGEASGGWKMPSLGGGWLMGGNRDGPPSGFKE